MRSRNVKVTSDSPGNKRECDSLAIPLFKRDEDIDRWLHVDVDPHPKRSSAPTSPPRVSSPANDIAHDLSLASLALTSSHSPLYLEDDDDHLALDSPAADSWSRGMSSRWSGGETDVFGGF